MFSQRLSGLISKAGGDRAGVLAVYSEAKDKDPAALQEDMRVMSHILEKAVEERAGSTPRARLVMGIDVFPGFGSEAVQSLYLEGYGALFLLNVNFPLLAPAGKEGEQPEARTARDSEWDTARRELFGQPEPALVAEPTEAYGEEKVTRLKGAIIDALRNAANIRALGSGDRITVCVAGGAAVRPVEDFAGQDPAAVGWHERTGRTMMTIRVTKADADECSKGSLSKEDFAKRAQVAVYSAPLATPSEWTGSGGGYNIRRGPAAGRGTGRTTF